jgi:5-methyltetrahydropteroyltriglutamate--homocysteine methyltransferase
MKDMPPSKRATVDGEPHPAPAVNGEISHRSDSVPLLPTSVVGSYSVPEWLERLKTDFYQHRMSQTHLREIHDVAIKAALKDQERAGVDIVSDGELRRDNDIDYFLARIPGIEIPYSAKTYYYDYLDAYVRRSIPDDGPGLGLVDDFLFTSAYTDHPIKFSFTGPFSLAKRVHNEAYADETDLIMALARVLNREAHDLAAAGAQLIQIDEPFLAGYPSQIDLAVRAINAVVDGVDTRWAVHICYGNRYARPLWEGHYDFLFPAVMEAQVHQVVLEFARKGYDDLDLFSRYNPPFLLGLGVIDVKSSDVESADLVCSRVLRAIRVLPPDRITVNPDCGLRHLPASVAQAKLAAMTSGAALARDTISGQHDAVSAPEQAAK